MILIVVAIAGLGFFLWASSAPDHRFRYKMTVEVDTPAGVRSGASVHEIRARYRNHAGLAPRSRTIDTTGEAVAVDLPGGQTLFVLAPGAESVQRAFDPEWKNDWVESAKRIATEGTSEAVSLPVEANRDRTPSGLPRQTSGLLVRFRDTNRPETIEEVQPARLDEAFGEGFSLRRITVQLTEEPLTSGIERRLPWLPDYYNLKFSGDRYSSAENQHKGIAAFMSSGAFSAGMGLSPHERRSMFKRKAS